MRTPRLIWLRLFRQAVRFALSSKVWNAGSSKAACPNNGDDDEHFDQGEGVAKQGPRFHRVRPRRRIRNRYSCAWGYEICVVTFLPCMYLRY